MPIPLTISQVANSQIRPALSKIDGRPAELPLVSAVIPAYNAATFLHVAIESTLAQTHHLLEIIVVDDGSSDDTAEVAARYPVTVIRQRNGGPASARNAGVMAASGEWIAFLDHDDSWHENKTEEQLKYVRPGISAVFSKKPGHADNLSFEDMFARNHGGNPSSTIIRADVLRTLGLFDDDPALLGVDDYNLWLRFLWAGYKFAGTPAYDELTPAENHYSSHSDKMFAAELVNINKIARLANLRHDVVGHRKRQLRLSYMQDLIGERQLKVARQNLRALGLSRETARYCAAFLPGWALDLRRAIVARLRRRGLHPVIGTLLKTLNTVLF